MIVARYVAGVVWAITAAVAGGWIAITPWTLGLQQPGGDWSTPTWNLVAVGVALAVLGVISFVTVHGILLGDLRSAGVYRRRSQDHEAAEEPAPERLVPASPVVSAAQSAPEDDSLTHLAHLLATELARSGEAAPAHSMGARG
jgi:hypothetical protein